MLGNFINAFVIILVGFSLMPMVMDQVNKASLNNIAGADVLVYLVPIVFPLVIIASALGVAYTALINSGLIGGGEEEDYSYEEEIEEKPVEEKPHKQTYLEYVKERLAVERALKRGY